MFVAMQLVGGVAGYLVLRGLSPNLVLDRPGPRCAGTGRRLVTLTVLFVCVHNAGRSQMAAGYLSRLVGDRVRVLSAGSLPGPEVNPVAAVRQAHPRRWAASSHCRGSPAGS